MPAVVLPLHAAVILLLGIVCGSALLLGSVVGATSTPPQYLKCCYLYFGSTKDFGWTFTFNSGRLKTHSILRDEFPNVHIESAYTQNVFDMSSDQKHALILRYVTVDQCNVVLSNNALLMNGEDDFFAATYPNVSFVLLDEARLMDAAHANRVYMGNDYTGGYYMAGAAAGAQSKSCIAFFAAWDDELDPSNAFAGFLLGVRRENQTVPVHLVTQNSWYFPDSDAVLADVFVRLVGCDVIARYSDPSVVDSTVAAIEGSGMSVFSIGPHANLEQYVGDTVLTSPFIDWSVALLAALRPLLLNGTLRAASNTSLYFFGVRDGAVTTAPVSPKARSAVEAARVAAETFLLSDNRTSVVCDVTLRNGRRLFNITEHSGVMCKLPWELLSDLVVDDYVVDHGVYRDRRTCPAGSAYTYTYDRSTRALHYSCNLCGRGTYTTSAGSGECAVCPSGASSDAGSSVCVVQPPLSAAAIVAIAAAGGVAVLAGTLLYLRSQSRMEGHRNAPRETPMCLTLIGVEGLTAMRRGTGAIDTAVRMYTALVRAAIARNHAYEVSCSDEGEFCIASKTVFESISLAIEVQEGMYLAMWPAVVRDLGGLRPRIVVHHCSNVVVEYSSASERYEYSGPDVDVAHELLELPSGGVTLAVEATVDALRQDPDYEMVIAYEVAIRHWRGNGTGYDEREGYQGASPVPPSQLMCIDSRHLRQLVGEGRRPVASLAASGVDHNDVLPTGGHVSPGKGDTVLPVLDGADPELEVAVQSWPTYSSRSEASSRAAGVDFTQPQAVMTVISILRAAGRGDPKRSQHFAVAMCRAFNVHSEAVNHRRIAACVAKHLFPSRVSGLTASAIGTDAHEVSTTSTDECAPIRGTGAQTSVDPRRHARPVLSSDIVMNPFVQLSAAAAALERSPAPDTSVTQDVQQQAAESRCEDQGYTPRSPPERCADGVGYALPNGMMWQMSQQGTPHNSRTQPSASSAPKLIDLLPNLSVSASTARHRSVPAMLSFHNPEESNYEATPLGCVPHGGAETPPPPDPNN